MARIRSVKPEIWTDDKFVELSAFARLLFMGLWNFADDEGRMTYSPKSIKLRILPADSVDVSELLGEIRGKSMIDIYVIDGQEYLQIINFAKHQKIDKRTPSKLPPKPRGAPSSPESPRNTSMEGIKEGKGRDQGEDQGKEGIKANTASPTPKLPLLRVTPIPDDFQISQAVRNWASLKGFDQLEEHRDYFVNQCHAKNYRYANHDAAFRGAISKDWAQLRTPRRNGNGHQTGPPTAGQRREETARQMFGNLTNERSNETDITAESKRVA